MKITKPAMLLTALFSLVFPPVSALNIEELATDGWEYVQTSAPWNIMIQATNDIVE